MASGGQSGHPSARRRNARLAGRATWARRGTSIGTGPGAIAPDLLVSLSLGPCLPPHSRRHDAAVSQRPHRPPQRPARLPST